MRHLIVFGLPVMGCLFLAACHTSKYSADHLPDNLIIFGRGGGVVGMEYRYMLCPNGQLFLQKGIKGSINSLGRIPLGRAKDAFRRVAEWNVSVWAYNEPGNMYQFVEWDGHRVAWNPHTSELGVPSEVPLLYNQLMDIVKQSGAE